MSDPLLARIPGPWLGMALSQLPDPSCFDAGHSVETVLDVPRFGLVRFSCRVIVTRGREGRRRWWTAWSAAREPVRPAK